MRQTLMEPDGRRRAVITACSPIPPTIHAFGVAQRRHADDLAAVAADLSRRRAAAADAFGPVGARFLAALATRLTQRGPRRRRLAERLAGRGPPPRLMQRPRHTSDADQPLRQRRISRP